MLVPLAMDKAAVIREIGERLERIGRLAAAVPQPPNPRPQESDASLKRKIARLRSGGSAPPIGTSMRPRSPARWRGSWSFASD